MMPAHIRLWLGRLGDMFWILPAALVTLGVAMAFFFLAIDRSDLISRAALESNWIYNGGATGARTLLGAVASSTIGVAGTVFSITIAALSLAAGQMGPRLLRNFVRDRGNQVTLGIFLATFTYSLLVLRSVRTESEGTFVPHLALTVALVLALLSVATLVYFVGHMAQRINVDIVIDLVSEDVHAALIRLTEKARQERLPLSDNWQQAALVLDPRRGYLQHVDEEGLTHWAADHDVAIKLLLKPGDYVFPGAPIAMVLPPHREAERALQERIALATQRSSADDLEYAIRQLVEVAVRALSPGINDPHTAISVVDRLGAALCDLANLHFRSGQLLIANRLRLEMPVVDYDGLTDAMFHLIRQNARGSASVFIRVFDVLTSVASVERAENRLHTLRRHASLFLVDAEQGRHGPADMEELRRRQARFERMALNGPAPTVFLDWMHAEEPRD